MRRIGVVGLCLGLAVTAMAAAAERGHIPKSIYADVRERPVWVRADHALLPDGSFDPALFDQGERRVLQSLLELPWTDGCIRLGVTRPDETVAIAGEPAPTDLESAVRAADWVVVATVTARATGFHGSLPGTLLELQPEQVFKGPQGRSWAQHVFMPLGTVRVGGSALCKSDPHRAELPEVGDQVLLLTDLSARDRLGILPTDAASITVLRRDGSVSLPQLFRGEVSAKRAEARQDLLNVVRLAVGEGR